MYWWDTRAAPMELSGRGTAGLWEGQGQNKRATRNWGTHFLFPWDHCPQTVITTALLSPRLWRLSLCFSCTWAQDGCRPANPPSVPESHFLTRGGRVRRAQLGLGVTPSSVHSAHGVQDTWDKHSA